MLKLFFGESLRFRLLTGLCFTGIVAALLGLQRYEATVVRGDYEWKHGPFHAAARAPREYETLLYHPLSGDPSAANGRWPSAPWYIRVPIYCGLGCTLYAMGFLFATASRRAIATIRRSSR